MRILNPAMNSILPALVALPYIRVLRVVGSDATTFLQGQLSRRIDNLSPEMSALAGWHDARGKVRVVFRVLPFEAGYLLIAPADLAEELQSTLSLFVLRADVRIELTDLVCAGLVSAPEDMPGDLPSEANAVRISGARTDICVAPGCWHSIGPPEALPLAGDVNCAAVVAAEIRAGLPQVDAHTTLRYVPHMLNLDKLGALDFEKGCYPGQEVIARTEHLGSVKRRARLFIADASTAPSKVPAAETPITNSDHERIGEVLRAAHEADGSLVMLAVVALDALGGELFLGNHNESIALRHIALPALQS